MKRVFKFIGMAIAFVVAYVAVKEIKQYLVNESALSNASVKTEETINKKIEEAQTKATDEIPTIQVMKDDAKKEYAESLKNETDELKKLNNVANNFFGYYLVNVEGRKEYCEKYGVPIPKFVSSFKNYNKQLFDKATIVQINDFKRNNMVYSYEKMYKLLQPALAKIIEQDVSDIKKSMQINDVQACQMFEERANEIPVLIDYKKINAEAVKILMQ